VALKLPCERHAHEYAMLEVWSGAARRLAREASVASTVLDPTSDSDEISQALDDFERALRRARFPGTEPEDRQWEREEAAREAGSQAEAESE